jgi:hypothetical protein
MAKQREYLQLLRSAKCAAETAIDEFNRVRHPYRDEATVILLTNAWELLAKALLVKKKQSIKRDRRGNTISAEAAVAKLREQKEIDENQEDVIQQVVSLRHAAIHHVLPSVPNEVMHHLLYFSLKFFRDVVAKNFGKHAKDLKGNYLSLAFADLTTYADKVQKLVSRLKKSPGDKKLIWLLERGVQFDGSAYMTEKQFEALYKNKKRIMPHLSLSDFIRGTDMVRIVPVQAPRNFTADITLRKGSSKDSHLPVLVKKTEVEKDYPYLTKDLGEKTGKNQNFIAATTAVLGMKGNPAYHQAVRASRKGVVHKYSEAAFDHLTQYFLQNPAFDPYLVAKAAAGQA